MKHIIERIFAPLESSIKDSYRFFTLLCKVHNDKVNCHLYKYRQNP
ncbi:hypothetical protein [Helicobacter sp. MIT 14-3879]|nr:hypothetical protein [Helicobacter sp. MIT 14-3879]